MPFVQKTMASFPQGFPNGLENDKHQLKIFPVVTQLSLCENPCMSLQNSIECRPYCLLTKQKVHENPHEKHTRRKQRLSYSTPHNQRQDPYFLPVACGSHNLRIGLPDSPESLKPSEDDSNVFTWHSQLCLDEAYLGSSMPVQSTNVLTAKKKCSSRSSSLTKWFLLSSQAKPKGDKGPDRLMHKCMQQRSQHSQILNRL